MFKWSSAKRLGLSVVAVAATALSAQAVPFNFAGPGANNVDTNPGTQVVLLANLVGTINDLNVSVNITGGHMEDFHVFLTSPSATTVQVRFGPGNPPHHNSPFNITFDDEAALGHGAIDAGAPNSVGTFQPFSALSAFDGQQLFGNWTLTIQDTFAPNEGNTLVGWSISGDFTPAGAAAPEPGTLALLGTGMLLGGMAVRRRLR